MQILAKIDRFGQFPQLNFRGNPKASTSVGIILTICIIVLLLALFSVLMASAVDTPTTTSIISPMSFTDELDLASGEFKFCTELYGANYDADGNPVSNIAIDLQQVFEQEFESRVQVYTLSDDNYKVDRGYTYCPDKSASPITHCICLKDESMKIRTSDTLYVKISFQDVSVDFPDDRIDYLLKTTITSLIPNQLSNALVKTPKAFKCSSYATGEINNAFLITLDRLVYKIDDDYFVASPKAYHSFIPLTLSSSGDDDNLSLKIQSWALKFSGQTITSETTATKVLTILAQVGALNGVFVIVLTILLLPFFRLKYAEKLINSVNKQPTSAKNDPKKDNDISTEKKQRVEAFVKQKTISKKPMSVGLLDWLLPKRASKIKTLQENETALKTCFDIGSIVRTNMEIELLKKAVLSSDQLYMIDNIPFDTYIQAQNGKQGRDTKERPPSESLEFLRTQTPNEDIQSRFVELMKKYYD